MYMFHSPLKQLVFWRKRRRKISFKTSSFSVIIFSSSFYFFSRNIEISKEVTDEKYDDDSKSKLIIKFYSRLNRHPKQVIRYSISISFWSIRYAYDGLPLLPCQPPTKIQPPRCKCGGQRVFECQILSSVISLFHIDDEDVYKQRTVMYKLVWYECPNLQPIRSPQVKIHGLLLSVVVLLWK